MRTKLQVAIFLCILICVPVPGDAQQKGQYIPGQQGLNAGILPDPGVTYANMTINYHADTLRNASGGATPLATAYSIWAIENILPYSEFQISRSKVSAI